MSGTASSASKGRATGSTKAKAKVVTSAGVGARPTAAAAAAAPSRTGLSSAGAPRRERSAAAGHAGAPVPAASPASARAARSHSSASASPAARQPRSTPSPSPGASLRRSSSLSLGYNNGGGGGGGGGAGGAGGSASPIALDLESILRLAGRAHVADDGDADEDGGRRYGGYGAIPPPLPPPPPPLVPAVPAPPHGHPVRRSSGAHGLAHTQGQGAATAVVGPPQPLTAPPTPLAPHAHTPAPHRLFTFPPEFLRDIEALKLARAQIAVLDERRRAGALGAVWTGAGDPEAGSAPHAHLDQASLALPAALREHFSLSVTGGGSGADTTLPWESPIASLYPPAPFVPLCSFPFSSPGGDGAPAGLGRPAPFRYPLGEKELAVVRERLRDTRRDRARAGRLASGGAAGLGEPSARAVDRAALFMLSAFESDRAELFGLHVRAEVERGVQRALAPVLARLAGAQGPDAAGAGAGEAAGPACALSTPEQLSLLKLSYALLRVGGRAGPQTRFGQSRRALPTFLAASAAPSASDSAPVPLPPFLQHHHLWSAAEEAEEARRMEMDEELEDERSDGEGAGY